MVKCGDEIRRPKESAVGNSERERRSRRENTKIRPRGSRDRYGGDPSKSYGRSSFLTSRETRVSWRAYASSADRFVWT